MLNIKIIIIIVFVYTIITIVSDGDAYMVIRDKYPLHDKSSEVAIAVLVTFFHERCHLLS